MLFKPHTYAGIVEIGEVQLYIESTFLAIAYAEYC
jgi:hypothetical protein